jgi:taurine dioxygenase
MRSTRVSGTLGAVIDDIDLRGLDADAAGELRQLIVEHEVVFVRGAGLDREEHLALGELLGGPTTFALFQLLGHTEPTLTEIEDTAESPPDADVFHTDVTWTAEPPDFAILQAEIVPEFGGDTVWSSLTAAYEGLSAPMQELVAGLTVRHHHESFLNSVEKKASDFVREENLRQRFAERFPAVDHPLVRTHPETGRRALFLGGTFMKRINEVSEAESDALLSLLRRHVEDARFHCRYSWQPGDLAIWDERSTNHRSAADHYPQHRMMRRCEVGGSAPYFDEAA